MRKRDILRKSIAGSLIAVSLASTTLSAFAYTTTFPDVNPGDWYYDTVMSMTARGLFAGIEEDGVIYFKPDKAMTRAEFLVVVSRVLELPVVEGGQWWEGAYESLKESGIVTGGEISEEVINEAMPREEMAMVAIRAAEYRGESIGSKYKDRVSNEITGVRVGECYGLLWSDIDWDRHTMSIRRQMVYEDHMWTLRNTKTKAAIRVIDLQDSIYNYLKDLRATQLRQREELGPAYRVNRVAVDMGRGKPKEIRDDLELINVKSNGEMLTPDSEKFLGRISRQELSVNFRFHNLRHTHASWLAEHNVPAIVTKKRLGHSKEETTLRYYTHITQGMRDDLLSKLNNS